MSRKSIPISLPAFWSGVSPVCIYKISQSSYGLSEENKNTDKYLLGQNAHSWLKKRRGYGSLEHSSFFTLVTGFCHKLKQIFDGISSGDKFVRMIINSKEMTTFLPTKKLHTIHLRCTRTFTKTQKL